MMTNSSRNVNISQGSPDTVDYFENWSDEKWMKEIKEFIKPTYYHIIFIVLYIFVFVCGIVGNFLVCFAVWRNHHLRTVTNYFLVNLACADFMVILVCMPLTLTQDITQSWFLGLAMCKTVLFLQNVSVLVSVLTLTAISLERYMAICQPLSFRGSKSKSILVIVLVWIISIGSAFPELIFLTLFPDEYVPAHINWLISCRPRDEFEEFIYQLCLTVLFYIVPLIIMGFAYIRIAHCLWKSTTAGPVINHASAENTASTLRTRKRTAKMLIIVVVLFFVCYLPVYILNVFRYTGILSKIQNPDVVKVFALGSRWLCYFNSAVNPVIYNFMSEKFKKEFKVACFCFKTKCMGFHKRRLYYSDPSEQPLRSQHISHKKFRGAKDTTVSSDGRTETIRLKSFKSQHVAPYRSNAA